MWPSPRGMWPPPYVVFDVTLSTGRYILYRLCRGRSEYFPPSVFPFPGGFALDQSGEPAVLLTPITDESGPLYHNQTIDFFFFDRKMFGFGWGSTRPVGVSSTYFYSSPAGPASVTLYGYDASTAAALFTSKGFTPCAEQVGEVKHDSKLFFDGDLFYSFTVNPWGWSAARRHSVSVFRLGADLKPVYIREIEVHSEPVFFTVSGWVCRRASTHPYVGLLWATYERSPYNARVYAVKRVDGDPPVQLEFMYDPVASMGAYPRGGVSAYVDNSCFAGALALSFNNTWRIYTFKWRPGDSFPPPLTLRESFRGRLLFLAMVSPDDYVAAYIWKDATPHKLVITGADRYTYTRPYGVFEDYGALTEEPWMFTVSPSGVAATTYFADYYYYWYVLMYIPKSQYWAHMNRDLEARVSRGGGRLLADGSVLYTGFGDVHPVGALAVSGEFYVALFDCDDYTISLYRHPAGSAERKLVKSIDVSDIVEFFMDAGWYGYCNVLCAGRYSYFTTFQADRTPVVCRLDMATLDTKWSPRAGTAYHVVCYTKIRPVDGKLYITGAEPRYNELEYAVLDMDLNLLERAALETEHRLLAHAPVYVESNGKKYVAAVLYDDNGRVGAGLVSADGSVKPVEWLNPDALPPTPRNPFGMEVDAWWSGGKVYAVASLTPREEGYDTKLVHFALDGGELKGDVLRTLRGTPPGGVDRRLAYSYFIQKLRVDGYGEYTVLAPIDFDYAYPAKPWHGERLWPMIEWFYSPLVTTIDGTLQYTPAVGTVLVPGSTLIGDYMYIVQPPTPKPPPSRRVLTLFRRGARRW